MRSSFVGVYSSIWLNVPSCVRLWDFCVRLSLPGSTHVEMLTRTVVVRTLTWIELGRSDPGNIHFMVVNEIRNSIPSLNDS